MLLLALSNPTFDFHYTEGQEEHVCFSELIVSDICLSFAFLDVSMFITHEYFKTFLSFWLAHLSLLNFFFFF